MRRRHRAFLAGIAALGASLTGAAATRADVGTFSAAGPNDVPAATTTSGPAGIYPWNLSVSSMPTITDDVNVSLVGVVHQRVPDIDALLVAPDGGGNVLFMSDIGDDADILSPGLSLTFNDGAGSNAPIGGPLSSGSYRPTNGGADPDAFQSPAPSGPYAAALSKFNDFNPNGTWRLYLTDDDGMTADPAIGSVASWSLQVTSHNRSTSNNNNSNKKKKAKKGKRKGSRGNGRRRCGRFRSRRRRILCKCRNRARYRASHPRRCRRAFFRAARRD